MPHTGVICTIFVPYPPPKRKVLYETQATTHLLPFCNLTNVLQPAFHTEGHCNPPPPLTYM